MTQTTPIAGTQHKTLQEAKLAVMRDVEYVQKTEGKKLGYTYASEPELIHALRDSMIEHGITMSPVGGEYISHETRDTKQGGAMRLILLTRVFRFTHSHSGEYDDVHVFGESGDIGDKAMGKAMTHAKKYALREYFLIETGDDPDTTRNELSSRRKMQDHFQRASQAIHAAEDVSALRKIMAHVTNPEKGFTDEQVAILSDLRDVRENQLKEKASE